MTKKNKKNLYIYNFSKNVSTPNIYIHTSWAEANLEVEVFFPLIGSKFPRAESFRFLLSSFGKELLCKKKKFELLIAMKEILVR